MFRTLAIGFVALLALMVGAGGALADSHTERRIYVSPVVFGDPFYDPDEDIDNEGPLNSWYAEIMFYENVFAASCAIRSDLQETRGQGRGRPLHNWGLCYVDVEPGNWGPIEANSNFDLVWQPGELIDDPIPSSRSLLLQQSGIITPQERSAWTTYRLMVRGIVQKHYSHCDEFCFLPADAP